MTPQQKMQEVVEAAGECWHEPKGSAPMNKCQKCKEPMGYHNCLPSPTDLNELFRLAEKLGIYSGAWQVDQGGHYAITINLHKFYFPTLAEALLNALYNALYEAVS
jgi:hypothetical protein